VSSAGLWELSAKASTGRLPEFAEILERGPDELTRALEESEFRLLAVELMHVESLFRLPPHHTDPFDRMMIAQALTENLTLISRDPVFERYAGLKLLAA
jgi:PIN domain nuclease of toxin-antitoxin system